MADSRGRFDRMADAVAEAVAHWVFFLGCCLLVGLWLTQGVAMVAVHGWSAFANDKFQLEINTTTTIMSFLMLALLHNTTHRQGRATNARLQEITEDLPDVDGDPVDDEGQRE